MGREPNSTSVEVSSSPPATLGNASYGIPRTFARSYRSSQDSLPAPIWWRPPFRQTNPSIWSGRRSFVKQLRLLVNPLQRCVPGMVRQVLVLRSCGLGPGPGRRKIFRLSRLSVVRRRAQADENFAYFLAFFSKFPQIIDPLPPCTVHRINRRWRFYGDREFCQRRIEKGKVSPGPGPSLLLLVCTVRSWCSEKVPS